MRIFSGFYYLLFFFKVNVVFRCPIKIDANFKLFSKWMTKTGKI